MLRDKLDIFVARTTVPLQATCMKKKKKATRAGGGGGGHYNLNPNISKGIRKIEVILALDWTI